MSSEYVKARKSQYHCYRKVPLYSKADTDKYVLYKPSGITLGEMRVSEIKHTEELFIKKDDKLKGIQEAQKVFNRRLREDIKTGDHKHFKETLVIIMEETLTEPRSGSLEGISETMDIISDYATKPEVIKNLLAVSSTDYSTILHSINVMALAFLFGINEQYSKPKLKMLGMAALLHDVGKAKIRPEILSAPRELTQDEFAEMQRHTNIGYDILNACKFGVDISKAALDHHEKLDKSGYPNGKGNISQTAQIIGIIDCYEALTNDDRPYRSAMSPFEALRLMKGDVLEGKFSKSLFKKFTYGLAH